MTDPLKEPLLAINCALYDPDFAETIKAIRTEKERYSDYTQVTLLDWAYEQANRDLSDKLPSADASMENWQQLIDTIKANEDVYGNIVILDVEQRESEGNMATFLYDGQVIIGFEGTHGTPDWTDNGVGAHPDVTDTPFQQEALAYYEAMSRGTCNA